MEMENAWLLVLDAHACIPAPPRGCAAADARWEELMAVAGGALARAFSFDRRLIAQLLDRDAAVGTAADDPMAARRMLLRLTMLAARHRHGGGPVAPRAQIKMRSSKYTSAWTSRAEKLTVSAGAAL